LTLLLRVQDWYFAAQDLPLRAWNLLLRLLHKNTPFSRNSGVSDSESTYYSSFVQSAVRSEAVFKSFRRNFYYRQILEHVNFKLGLEYLSRLSDQSKSDLHVSQVIAALSTIGSPRRFYFPNLGLVSPTLIRYKHVSQELKELFGESVGKDVVEIGVGFGGQYALLINSCDIKKYTMFDLPQVIQLTHKVLNASGIDDSRIVQGDIEDPSIQGCDLVISNYAFSELPREIQIKYIHGVFAKSRRGYLIMNSGKTDISGRSSGKFALQELQELLPPFEVLDENPLTGPDNYVIVWGHKR
jgi:hypothetical protein